MCTRWLALLVFSLGISALLAQPTPPPPNQEQTMQILLDRIQQLEKRVSELEDHKRKQSAAQTGTSDSQTVAESTPVQANAAPAHALHSEHPANTTEIREMQVHYPSLQIRGFGDIDFSATDQKGSVSGFDLGQFVLHLASPLSEKVSYFGEVSFTAQPSGYDLQVERTIIRYDYNDYFKMSFGKYHTPIGYWNTAFHHGAWLQTTISRPEMVKIGGTFTPIHFVGLLAEGNLPSGGLGLGYSVGLGNGRSSILSKAGDSGDSNDNRAWVASVFARPARFYGLQFGGSVYHDKLSPLQGPELREWITSAHLVWTKEHPEFLAEFANVHHRDIQTSQTFNNQAFYIQVAYRLPWLENKWKPYYRFEYIHKPESEPVLSDVSDLVGSTFGVRYDITNYAAFKGEYRNTRHGINEPRVNGVFLQTAFTF
ncbi:MAG: hypothetical protein DMG72_12115 [Acidobacteria bacterium]|nr:MAG: hypothetical protein DMG72_12115 [Acidobacteriota bacterium]